MAVEVDLVLKDSLDKNDTHYISFTRKLATQWRLCFLQSEQEPAEHAKTQD